MASKTASPKKFTKRKPGKFKDYLELVQRHPNMTRATLAARLKVTELTITGWKFRHEAEEYARERREKRDDPTMPKFPRKKNGEIDQRYIKRGRK